MISKNQIKFIRSLHVKKNRLREGLFIAEGEKIVEELLKSSFQIHSVCFTNGWKGGNKIEGANKKLYEITEEELNKISLLEKPNKVFAVARIPENNFEIKNIDDEFTLMLDDIQDPGNLGTIIRTTDWFGIKNILCSKDTVDVYNPKVVQATMGSLFRVKIFYADLKETLIKIKSELRLPVYAAVVDGENILNKKLKPKSILLLGNESKGINKELLQFADEKISIPKTKERPAESLNVAVAASILCYEFCNSR